VIHWGKMVISAVKIEKENNDERAVRILKEFA
jgi:hypothetical protein